MCGVVSVLETGQQAMLRAFPFTSVLKSTSVFPAASMMSKLAAAKQVLGAKVRLGSVGIGGVSMLISILSRAYFHHGFGGVSKSCSLGPHTGAPCEVTLTVVATSFYIHVLPGVLRSYLFAFLFLLDICCTLMFLGVSGGLEIHACMSLARPTSHLEMWPDMILVLTVLHQAHISHIHVSGRH